MLMMRGLGGHTGRRGPDDHDAARSGAQMRTLDASRYC